MDTEDQRTIYVGSNMTETVLGDGDAIVWAIFFSFSLRAYGVLWKQLLHSKEYVRSTYGAQRQPPGKLKPGPVGTQQLFS